MADNVATEIVTEIAQTQSQKVVVPSCKSSWIPSQTRMNVVIGAFLVAVVIAFINKSYSHVFAKDIQFLIVLPIVISFSGNMGVQNLTRTLLIWKDTCFKTTSAKMSWLLYTVSQGFVLSITVSAIGILVLSVLRFKVNVIMAVCITLILATFMSSILAIVYPVALTYLHNNESPRYAGSLLLLSNDILVTLIYITIASRLHRSG